MILRIRLAWRNLWRHSRRTWLTATAMIFSNVLLVFMISLQFGSYEMMINNTLQAFSGHLQVQAEGFNENPKMRSSIAHIRTWPGRCEAPCRIPPWRHAQAGLHWPPVNNVPLASR